MDDDESVGLPVTLVATVTFRSYDPDGRLTMPIADRIRQCIETHPTLSFAVDSVVVTRGDDGSETKSPPPTHGG